MCAVSALRIPAVADTVCTVGQHGLPVARVNAVYDNAAQGKDLLREQLHYCS